MFSLFLQLGSVSVERFGNDPANPANAPVVLLPSLINQSYIFCFGKDNGIAGYLMKRQGVDLYLIRFHNPLYYELSASLEDYMMQKILPAINAISKVYTNKITIIGYCMGGVLSICAAIHAENQVGSLILISTPWDFSEGIYNTLREYTKLLLGVIDKMQIVPAEFINFSLLQPKNIFLKYDRLAINMTEKQKKQFWAIEDWLHDGLNMTKKVAKEILGSWITENSLVNDRWIIGNKVITPRKLHIPIFLMITKNDSIVPLRSAVSLLERINFPYTVFSDKGHIDLFVRKNPAFWSLMYNWIVAHTTSV